MDHARRHLADELASAARDLTDEQLEALLRFAAVLSARAASDAPVRGSAGAILAVVERHGTLIFEPGELDAVLTDLT